jgi:hypothetical protein
LGGDVEITVAQEAKGIAPLTCKTDTLDACVLAEFRRHDLVPADLVAGPGRARRTGASSVPASSRPPPGAVEEPHPFEHIDSIAACTGPP